jgi:signal transduction histidine kinase
MTEGTMASGVDSGDTRERQLEQLLAVTGELASATRFEVVAELAIRAIGMAGATSGGLWALTGDRLELIGIADRHANVRTQYSSIAVDSATPLGHAVRTGEGLFLTPQEYRERFPVSFERIQRDVPWGDAMFAVLPLVTYGRPFGGIAFSYVHAADSHENRMYLELVVRQCAVAFERVKLLEAERAARQAAEGAAAGADQARKEAELLYDLAVEVNRTDDLARIYELALMTVERGARCERSAILLYDHDGVIRFKSSRGLSETYRRAVEGHTPWQRDDREPRPVIVDNVFADAAWVSYADVFRAEGIAAIAFVPLVRHGKLLGKFMLYRNQPRAFSGRDIQIAATVAVHVAQALERKRADMELARAYDDEKRTRVEAEEATRAREEILSMVSHDLRNPLAAVVMSTVALGNLDLGDPEGRVAKAARRIRSQAERMARLIEDLVDFSGIQAGRIKLEPRRHAPDEILQQATEIFAPLASERGLKLATSAPTDLPFVLCDSHRTVQVLSNLVANAIKVTPKGGEIAIGAQTVRDEIVFYVRDSGPGIDPEDLPNLFERYWRAQKSTYKGAGLGLSIARGIVDAHGGRIWAESKAGNGATFYFAFAGMPRN